MSQVAGHEKMDAFFRTMRTAGDPTGLGYESLFEEILARDQERAGRVASGLRAIADELKDRSTSFPPVRDLTQEVFTHAHNKISEPREKWHTALERASIAAEIGGFNRRSTWVNFGSADPFFGIARLMHAQMNEPRRILRDGLKAIAESEDSGVRVNLLAVTAQRMQEPMPERKFANFRILLNYCAAAERDARAGADFGMLPSIDGTPGFGAQSVRNLKELIKSYRGRTRDDCAIPTVAIEDALTEPQLRLIAAVCAIDPEVRARTERACTAMLGLYSELLISRRNRLM